MKDFTPKQKEAIANMNKAIKQLKSAGVVMFGMDCDLYYISKKAIQDCRETNPKIGERYNEGADTYKELSGTEDYRKGTFDTSGVYLDSGGW